MAHYVLQRNKHKNTELGVDSSDLDKKIVAMVTATARVDLPSSDFQPRSELRTTVHDIARPKFPVIDYHNHLDALDPADVLRIDKCVRRRTCRQHHDADGRGGCCTASLRGGSLPSLWGSDRDRQPPLLVSCNPRGFRLAHCPRHD